MVESTVPALLVSEVNGVLWLTLNRPEARNAINHELRALLLHAITVTAQDPKIRVVVIQGDEKAFCSGGDVKEMGVDKSIVAVKLREGSAVIQGVANLAKPVIAGVRGHASGAGFSLAMACDHIVAQDDATFTSIFSKRGLIPDLSGTFWLARQVGLYRAKDIVFSARPVSAIEAHSLGLVTTLTTVQNYQSELNAVVERFATGPTLAYGLAKRLLNQTFESDLATALEREGLSQGELSTSNDHLNAIEAFKKKTEPTFEGS
jgi:2-(1,2-epoxy-1,2-dihydrophenyl)acetyl-CoA isomerase